ncbi:hypothetical protein PCI56_26555 [Plesiomonas shigelloides subsp. oncorhynchi]|nr:hypothetical protein [Plesiomonas shigelloides]
MLFNNCEHFVHWVLHGKARSQQVNNALIGLTTVVLTGVGRWALKNTVAANGCNSLRLSTAC